MTKSARSYSAARKATSNGALCATSTAPRSSLASRRAMSVNVGWPARSIPATRARLSCPGSRRVDQRPGHDPLIENRAGDPDNAIASRDGTGRLGVDNDITGHAPPPSTSSRSQRRSNPRPWLRAVSAFWRRLAAGAPVRVRVIRSLGVSRWANRRDIACNPAEYALVHRMLFWGGREPQIIYYVLLVIRPGRGCSRGIRCRQSDRLPGGRADRHRAGVGARMRHWAVAVASLVGPC